MRFLTRAQLGPIVIKSKGNIDPLVRRSGSGAHRKEGSGKRLRLLLLKIGLRPSRLRAKVVFTGGEE